MTLLKTTKTTHSRSWICTSLLLALWLVGIQECSARSLKSIGKKLGGQIDDWQQKKLREAQKAAEKAAAEAKKAAEEAIAKAKEEAEKLAIKLKAGADLSEKNAEHMVKLVDHFIEEQNKIIADTSAVAGDVLRAIVSTNQISMQEVIADFRRVKGDVDQVAAKAEDCLKKLKALAEKAKKLAEFIEKYGDRFPDRNGANPTTPVSNPDVDLVISAPIINSNLTAFLAQEPSLPSPADRDDGCYIILKGGKFWTDMSRNTLLFSLTSGSCDLEKLKPLVAHPHVSNVTLEVFPRLVQTNGGWFLEAKAGVVSLHIDKAPVLVDRLVAGLIHEKIIKRKFSLDVTDRLTCKFNWKTKPPFSGKEREIRAGKVLAAAVFAEADGVRLKVRYTPATAAAQPFSAGTHGALGLMQRSQ